LCVVGAFPFSTSPPARTFSLSCGRGSGMTGIRNFHNNNFADYS
jgi:hypothetical protein